MSPSLDAAIDLSHVTKVYRKRVHALQDVSLQVHRGEVFGLLGPNGAGKSTLIKIMMTVVRPTRADGLILGQRVGNKAMLARVGYLPEHHRFPRYLTGRQTLEFFAALAGVDRQTRRRRSAELIETVGMTAWADKKVGEYSKGMMQRIGLAQALVNDPDLVLLDEPTDGVDPVGRRDIRQVLQRMRDLGKTVFINSHLLSELEMICDRVAILVGGKVARQGRIDELNVTKQRYEIDIVSPTNVPHALMGPMRELFVPAAPIGSPGNGTPGNGTPGNGTPGNGTPGNGALGNLHRGALASGVWVELENDTIRVGTVDPAEIQILLDRLRSSGVTIRRVQVVKPSLEDLYLEAVIDPLTGRSVAPGAAVRA